MVRMRRQVPVRDDPFPGFADVAEIGVGRSGTVYRARELGTNRRVALKLLDVRDAAPAALAAFERETAALAAISSHPNIVTLYGSFRVADGRPVLVLERCTGPVFDLLRGARGLPARTVLSIGVAVAGALETAHRAGILHRDVKPQNVLVTRYGEPALADFAVGALRTATETTAGPFDVTPLSAPPELLEGAPASPTTDVYELASSMYQMLAGRSAFRVAGAGSPPPAILRIRRDPVPSLVHLPDAFSDLLRRAMSTDPAARPASAAEFAAELVAIERSQGWPAKRPAPRPRPHPAGSVPR